MRYILVASLLLLLSSPASAEKEPNPLDVPTVPTPTEPVPEWLKYKNPYSGEQNNLSNPHRTSEEITTWAQNAAAEVTSFMPGGFTNKLTEIKKMFTPQGWVEYATWMRDSQIADMVRAQNYGVSTIINGNVRIINNGSVAGVYHWLVEMPVIVTFLHPDSSGKQQPLSGGKFRLVIQLGRMAAEPEEDGLIIEGWKVSNYPTEK